MNDPEQRSRSFQMVVPPADGQLDQGDGAPRESIFLKLHQLLQGRYKWAVLLFILGVTAGGALGYYTTVPQYRSSGLLYVEPVVRSSIDPEAKNVPPMLSAYIDSRVVYMSSDRVLRRALESERMQKEGFKLSAEELAELKRSLSITRPRGGLNIHVNSMREDAKTARVTVNAVIEAFQDLSQANSFQQDTERLREAEKTETLLQSKIEDITNRILDSAMEYGGPMTLEAEAKVWLDMLAEASMAVRRLSRELEAMGVDPESASEEPELPGEAGESGGAKPEISNEDIALQNPTMANLLLERDRLLTDIDILREEDGLGDQHPSLLRANRHLAVIDKGIARIRAAYLRARPDRSVGMSEVDRKRAMLRMHVEAMQLCRVEAQQLGRIRARIERESSDKEALVNQLDRERRLIEELQFQLRDKGRISVVSWGEESPGPVRDDKLRNAALLAVLMGGAGVGLVLLRSVIDRRLQSSVDVSSGLRTVRMLGLLPNIEKKLLDPEGAELARHAVHHIRTLLQIEHSGEEGRVLCVTGSAPAIGKTTLSLALGQSFSASNSRTLLVDCDFYGRGLSRHFNAVIRRRIDSALGIDTSGAENGQSNGKQNGNGHNEARKGGVEVFDPFEVRGRVTEQDIHDLLVLITDKLGAPRALSEGVLKNLIALARQCIPVERRGARGGKVWDWLAEILGPYPGPERDELFAELSRPAGLQYAMESAPLADCVEKSDSPGLEFLPLGFAAHELAPQISMSTVIRILDAARDEYDTVILDTGPIPGSLGASMVASQADGTIVLVSRGQDRVEVEQAIVHLRAVNATVDGLVFNRAEMRDALRVSVSGSRYALSRRDQDDHS